MVRVVPFIVAGWALVAAGLDANAGPRKGKVVRVERSRGRTSIPRVCDVRGDLTGTCLGPEPVTGETIAVLDETGVVAEVRIKAATPFSAGSTSCTSLWNVTTDVIRGDVAAVAMRTIGVSDPELNLRRARNLPREQFPQSPSGRSNEVVVMAVDRDGDATADLVLTQGPCDTSASSSCIDEYVKAGGRLTRVHQTDFASCGF